MSLVSGIILSTALLLTTGSLREPIDVIRSEGQLKISDGISIFHFQKGGEFELIPLFAGGRVIRGDWKILRQNPRCFYVSGEWRWTKGFTLPADYRTIMVEIDPIGKETIRYVKGEVYASHFTITPVRRPLSYNPKSGKTQNPPPARP